VHPGATAALAIAACVAALVSAGTSGAAQSFVRFEIAADLSAGDAGDEIAGRSTVRYRCDARRTLSNRIWFERRASGSDAWERIEPAGVAYGLARFADRRRIHTRVLRASVTAPRSSFTGAGTADVRLHSRATFTCGDHRLVARSQTLALPGLGA
jgi:hypothetical protein